MSMMSAPSAIIRRACASARSGAMNWPPSENESGVTLRTPITAGDGRDKSACQPGRLAEPAEVPSPDEIAIMGSLCAVPAGKSRRRKRGLAPFAALVVEAGQAPNADQYVILGGSLRALSINCSTDLSEGRTRTSLRLMF